MKYIYTTSLIIFIALLSSCSKSPEACIVIDKGTNRVTVGDEVHFIAGCRQNAKNIKWEIVDSRNKQVITRQSVKYRFNTPGTYQVMLEVSNNKISSQSIQVVYVYPENH